MMNTTITIEEYIPLKVLINNEEDEAIEYLCFKKEDTSYLELSIGKNTHLIKRIILLLSKEYEISRELIKINKYEELIEELENKS